MNTWDEPGYFETAEEDPLEIESINGSDPEPSDYDRVYVVGGQATTLSDFVIDYLIKYGKFEAADPDVD